MKAILGFIAGLGLSLVCSAQDNRTPIRILVFPFLGDAAEVTGWVQSFGEDLAALTVAELEATGRCTAVRAPADGAHNDASMKPVAGPRPDLLLLGTVYRFGTPNRMVNSGSPKTSTLDKGRRAEVSIAWQLVDPTGLSLLGSGVVQGQESGRSISFKDGYAPGVTISRNHDEFTNSALGKATFEAIGTLATNACALFAPPASVLAGKWQRPSQVEESPLPRREIPTSTSEIKTASTRDIKGRILGGSRLNLLIDVGRNSGVNVGDRYRVFDPADTDVSSGTIEIREVQEDLSMGVYEGKADPKSGWNVRSR